jgi:regulator of replication initiation timing/uncharacterized coiled-coil protein SlyX
MKELADQIGDLKHQNAILKIKRRGDDKKASPKKPSLSATTTTPATAVAATATTSAFAPQDPAERDKPSLGATAPVATTTAATPTAATPSTTPATSETKKDEASSVLKELDALTGGSGDADGKRSGSDMLTRKPSRKSRDIGLPPKVLPRQPSSLGQAASGAPPSSDGSTTPTTAAAAAASSEPGAHAKWEAEKKFNARIAQLKDRLEKKTEELKSLQTRLDEAKTKMDRNDKEKTELLSQIASLRQQMAESGKSSTPRPTDADVISARGVDEFRARAFAAEEALQKVEKVVKVEKEAIIAKLNGENKRLTDKVADLERESKDATATKEKPKGAATPRGVAQGSTHVLLLSPIPNLTDTNLLSVSIGELRAVKAKAEDLEAKLLETTCANLELKYEHEANANQLARLRARVTELTQMNKLLNDAFDADVGETKEVPKRGSGAPAKGAAAAAAVPAKKRDVAQLINRFQKTIEQLQAENDTLKKNSFSNVKYMDVRSENKRLKDKLAAATAAAEEAKKNDPEKEALTAEVNRLKGLYSTSQTNLKKQMDSYAKAKKKVMTFILCCPTVTDSY